jgi:hypothetical protein
MGSPITRHSFGALQVAKEAKELVPRSIPFEFAVQRVRFAECPFLHRQRRFQVNLGRIQGFVAEPQAITERSTPCCRRSMAVVCLKQ